MTTSKLRGNLLSFLPAAIWYTVIFQFSAQTGHRSSALSDGLAYRLMARFWPAFFLQAEAEGAAILETVTFFLRKGAHMAVYFILAGLLLWALRRWPGTWRRAAVVLLLCGALAGLAELPQTFVPGRNGQFRDVLIDLTGSVLLLLPWQKINRCPNQKKNRKSPFAL